MTKSFEFELFDGRMATVDVEISCRDSDGCDAWYDNRCISLANGDLVDVEVLPKSDLDRLDARCEELCSEYGYEAAMEWAEGAADRLYESWKDGDR